MNVRIDPWYYGIRLLLRVLTPFGVLGSAFASVAVAFDRLLHRGPPCASRAMGDNAATHTPPQIAAR